MQKVTRAEKELLLVHLLRSEQVFLKAHNKLQRSHFDELDGDLTLIWEVIAAFYAKHRMLPTRDVLLVNMRTVIESEPSQAYHPFAAGANDLVDLAFNPDALEQLMPEVVISTVLQPLLDAKVREFVELASNQQDLPGLLASFSSALAQSRVTAVEETKLFDLDNPDFDIAQSPPVATGAAVFDHITGGGIRRSNCGGLLGPSGGCKTTMTLEAAVRLAAQGRHAAVYQYESPINPTIRNRVWSCLTGVSTKVFAHHKISQLPADIRAKLEQYRDIDKYLHCVDLHKATCGVGGMLEVQAMVDDLAQQDCKPDLVIVDWLGLQAMRYMGAHGLDQDAKRGVMEQACNDARYNIANKYDTQVVICQQLNADAGSKGVRYRATQYDAADYKQFGNLMDFCIVASRKDANNILSLFTDKMREDAQSLKAQILGDICRMRVMDGHLIAIPDEEGNLTWASLDDLPMR